MPDKDDYDDDDKFTFTALSDTSLINYNYKILNLTFYSNLF